MATSTIQSEQRLSHSSAGLLSFASKRFLSGLVFALLILHAVGYTAINSNQKHPAEPTNNPALQGPRLVNELTLAELDSIVRLKCKPKSNGKIESADLISVPYPNAWPMASKPKIWMVYYSKDPLENCITPRPSFKCCRPMGVPLRKAMPLPPIDTVVGYLVTIEIDRPIESAFTITKIGCPRSDWMILVDQHKNRPENRLFLSAMSHSSHMSDAEIAAVQDVYVGDLVDYKNKSYHRILPGQKQLLKWLGAHYKPMFIPIILDNSPSGAKKN